MLAQVRLDQYVEKLGRRRELSDGDRTALLSLPTSTKAYAANDMIVRDEADPCSSFCVINTGFVSCFKVVEQKRRQIVAFALPGDAIDLPSLLLGHPISHVQASVATTTTWIAHEDLRTLCRERPAVAEAVWLDTLIDANISREWAANIGQRPGSAKLSHLLLELHARMGAAGLSRDNSFKLPFNQQALADALGLSLVHCNKSLQRLRRTGLVKTAKQVVTLVGHDQLVQLTGFDARYLSIGPMAPVSAEAPETGVDKTTPVYRSVADEACPLR